MRGPSRKVIALLTSPKVIMCYAGTFCYTSKAIREQMKCWELLAQRFYRFETLPSNSQNMQQHPTGQGCALAFPGGPRP